MQGLGFKGQGCYCSPGWGWKKTIIDNNSSKILMLLMVMVMTGDGDSDGEGDGDGESDGVRVMGMWSVTCWCLP